ncbi:MAG: hypothetical protein ABSF59_17435 [Candidatus Sulfotelmatobacter sp.]|jgi:hypothetical protein
MANGIAPNSSFSDPTSVRPRAISYDSGYEFSLDRCVDVKILLQDADKEISYTPATYAGAY